MFPERVKAAVRDAYWGFYGRGLKNPPIVLPPKNFVFICKGNVCRSPFAERYSILLANSLGLNTCRFSSMGLEVSQNLPPPPEALLAASELGVSLNDHRSRKVDDQTIAGFDMIVAMDARQFLYLRQYYEALLDRIFLLPLFVPMEKKSNVGFSVFNIADPYGKSLEHFHRCFQEIRVCLDSLFGAMVVVPRTRPDAESTKRAGRTQ